MVSKNPNKKFSTKSADLTRSDIERAMKNTLSNKGAARYIGVDFVTYKKYAKMYTGEDGRTLFEIHKNQAGVGVPKAATRLSRGPNLLDILEGKVTNYLISMKEIKGRLIAEGYMIEECARCKFHEKRVLDQKVPIIVNYIDGNKRNWRLENLEFLCYNCYFLHIGDVFQKKQIDAMEDYTQLQSKSIDFDLPKIHEQKVKEAINLENKYIYTKDDLPDSFGDDLIVSRKPK
jgi:hypothetical protein